MQIYLDSKSSGDYKPLHCKMGVSMRFAVLALVFLLLFSIHVAAQGQASKDPAALTVLTQMAAATGWNSQTLPRDAVATGTVTRHEGDAQTTASFTLKVKGCREYRVDVQDTAGTRSTIVNGDSAATFTANGVRPIPPHSAISMQPLALPFFCGLAAFADPNISLRYAGTESAAGELAHRVEISRQLTSGDPLAAPRQRASRLTVWISTTSGLPLQVACTRIAEDNLTAGVTTIRLFSDFRMVNGIAVPSHQEERAGGQLLYSLQLGSVSFNAGLTDAEFALPPVGQ